MQPTIFRFLRLAAALSLGLVLIFPSSVPAENGSTSDSGTGPKLPIILESAPIPEESARPPVAFDHDLHTEALGAKTEKECKACHELWRPAPNVNTKDKVAVYDFPLDRYRPADGKAGREAFHEACASCHKARAGEGKKTGPPIGKCAACHTRNVHVTEVSWSWKPVFDYKRHNKHVVALDKKCDTCHHIYDKKTKKLVYKKDTENSCRACHKDKAEGNARSFSAVAHADCIGCHMKRAKQGMKKNGPFDCKGCHGTHKELKPEEIKKIPRLVRGQKDVVDVSLKKGDKAATMKVVPFNHKAHEPRTQFCSTCHHYSMEKCSNCHPVTGDAKKGGGVTFEQAFHDLRAKQACVGCHNAVKAESQCAGCHQWFPDTKVSQVSCPICHRGTTDGKPVDAEPIPLDANPRKVKEKLEIKTIAREYKPATLPHQKIVKKLREISNKNSLARVFHAGYGAETLCRGCHHRTQTEAAMENAMPKCSSCHGEPFKPGELGKPGLMGAYHQQCIGCHETMKIKPRALQCEKCHPSKKKSPVVMRREAEPETARK